MEDLIEFFEFIPVNFVNELDTEITTVFLTELKNDSQIMHDMFCEDVEFDLYNEIINKQLQLINEIQMLVYEKDIQETIVNVCCTKDKYSKLLEYVNLHIFYENDEENFNCLLEYREIRSDILKKEWEKLKMIKPYLYNQNN
ncbi:hypothetical protein NAPIS_ORF00242 [Vairimorpha apis BRL 01]|uniref:Uncharacterized protein n=1 Tax=Vairimorpha apis BRL 01 TaxID=1037528 RepID=T0L3W2_9MICR|nr:hypothetical protein NAPIS_ORF00242 [Vairimorpha apis BRL 01]